MYDILLLSAYLYVSTIKALEKIHPDQLQLSFLFVFADSILVVGYGLFFLPRILYSRFGCDDPSPKIESMFYIGIYGVHLTSFYDRAMRLNGGFSSAERKLNLMALVWFIYAYWIEEDTFVHQMTLCWAVVDLLRCAIYSSYYIGRQVPQAIMDHLGDIYSVFLSFPVFFAVWTNKRPEPWMFVYIFLVSMLAEPFLESHVTMPAESQGRAGPIVRQIKSSAQNVLQLIYVEKEPIPVVAAPPPPPPMVLLPAPPPPAPLVQISIPPPLVLPPPAIPVTSDLPVARVHRRPPPPRDWFDMGPNPSQDWYPPPPPPPLLRQQRVLANGWESEPPPLEDEVPRPPTPMPVAFRPSVPLPLPLPPPPHVDLISFEIDGVVVRKGTNNLTDIDVRFLNIDYSDPFGPYPSSSDSSSDSKNIDKSKSTLQSAGLVGGN